MNLMLTRLYTVILVLRMLAIWENNRTLAFLMFGFMIGTFGSEVYLVSLALQNIMCEYMLMKKSWIAHIRRSCPISQPVCFPWMFLWRDWQIYDNILGLDSPYYL